jgi:hypothetical protein
MHLAIRTVAISYLLVLCYDYRTKPAFFVGPAGIPASESAYGPRILQMRIEFPVVVMLQYDIRFFTPKEPSMA